jgi:hypothetical protein
MFFHVLLSRLLKKYLHLNLNMLKISMHIRKKLNGGFLFTSLKKIFDKIPDWRKKSINKKNGGISISDSLMSNFAIFSLKDPSLLEFERRIQNNSVANNIKNIYHIENIPSDTRMREINDEVETSYIKPGFKEILRPVQRGKVLRQYKFMGGYYLTSMDGTGYFSSDSVHCDNCQVSIKKKTGEIKYSHAMLTACIVHPNLKTVLPIGSEAIIKQDGQRKNDCERNGGKRLLEQLRKDHPKLPLVIVEDALASNMPHIEELQKHDMRFILGVKPDGNKFLFNCVEEQAKKGNVIDFTIEDEDKTRRYRFINNEPLNASNQDFKVNFFEYWETTGKKTKHFSWITDFEITRKNVKNLVKGGRSRWKIENETFNTLKNQGYNFEHNYGHGYKNLSVNMAILMLLAFLIDQVQQLCCKLFQKALEKEGRKCYFWDQIRTLFKTLNFDSWQMLLQAVAYGFEIGDVKILNDTS